MITWLQGFLPSSRFHEYNCFLKVFKLSFILYIFFITIENVCYHVIYCRCKFSASFSFIGAVLVLVQAQDHRDLVHAQGRDRGHRSEADADWMDAVAVLVV